MASSLDFVEYVLEQIGAAGDITFKRMFGEYGFHRGGKYFGCVCDNQFFIKITDPGKALVPDCETAIPHEGAKPYFLISDLDDKELLVELIRKTCDALPMPKPKKKKTAER